MISPATSGSIALPLNSPEEFDELTSPFRRELLAHSYRMLGSMDDAEDAVQEALSRAWLSRATFTRAVSMRAWLYRITTNTCLDQIDRRKRTPGSIDRSAVQPIPENLLSQSTPGPESRYDAHESISLAFLTALQLLSPRQRSVLILRDVLSWRASEVAALLDMSAAATNSALHRARATLARGYVPVAIASDDPKRRVPGRLQALLERYVRAWETADIAGLVALLREDAVVTMPPGVAVVGRDAIEAFLETSVFDGGRRIRIVPIASNGSTVYLLSSRRPADAGFEPYAVVVVDLDPDASNVTRMTVFAEHSLVDRFVEANG